jgi:hypothetical protein
MLSAYQPGSPATPFENYCTSGLAYFLQRGHRMLSALFGQAAGAHGEPLALVEVQSRLGDAGLADLLLTFEGGKRVVVEVQVESAAAQDQLPALIASGTEWAVDAAFVMLTVAPDSVPAPWQPVSWLDLVEALDGDPDPLAEQYAAFVLLDILGLGPVELDEAIGTNRLYALGGAALRKRFGERARCVNSASRPMNGRYRYLGTTFSLDGGDMAYWIGIVNEGLPLSEHYHLMLATKATTVAKPAQHPRVTADWKWQYWTAAGRVVRPITPEAYDDLLGRLHL